MLEARILCGEPILIVQISSVPAAATSLLDIGLQQNLGPLAIFSADSNISSLA